MPFVKPDPVLTRGRVDAAGKMLTSAPVWKEDREKAIEIVNHWRLCHAFPLQVIKMSLLRWAKKVDLEAVVAQRTKRLPSIESKLQREPNMQLSQMHDIGGCRAVVEDIEHIDELHNLYRGIIEEETASGHGHEFVKPYDYISNPKRDGYRGIHLVYKYKANTEHNECYNGLRVEVQIRSSFQHAWATAVETVSLFIGQELKFYTTESPWKRFFALMSSAIALWEDRPTVPDTPSSRQSIGAELRKLGDELEIEDKFAAWGSATEHLITNPHDALLFLVMVDREQRAVTVKGFNRRQAIEAQAESARLEREIAGDSSKQSVLIGASEISSLRKAYPNYYLDLSAFHKNVRDALDDK